MEAIAPPHYQKMPRSKKRFISRGMMPIIAEDGVSSDVPRPSPTGITPNGVPRIKRPYPTYYPPPPYKINISTPDLSPKESLSSIRKDRYPAWLTKRGRWVRIVLFSLIGAVAVAALVVGLIIGLRRRHHLTPAPAAAAQPILFPAGSYSFITALQNTSTACTSNSATFRCYPSTTYDSSSPASVRDSMATFLWKIVDDGEGEYGISAAPNPFVPQFRNISLDLVDGNQDSERLVFEIGKMALEVVPIEPVAGDNSSTSGNKATICYFNDTVLTATIWTRRRAEYPTNLTTSVDNLGNGTHTSVDYDIWPYAVEVSQVVRAGASVPDCRDADGNPVGHFEVPQPSNECGCWYRNFDLDS